VKPTGTMRLVSRRGLLAGGAAAAVLPACDRLVLPEEQVTDDPEVVDGPDGLELSPITSNEEFYVTSCCGTPDVDPDTWQLLFMDNGAVIGSIDLAALEALPAREKEHTLQCIGSGPANQAISNAVWGGLPLVEVLAHVGVTLREDALQIVLAGAEGYTTAIPRSDLDALWLVWQMNGDSLPRSHGFPARLLVPGRYGTKNVKWLSALEVVDEPYTGFWERFGWNDEATYLANGFIRLPRAYGEVPREGATVLGTAFAGADPIARVEFSDDGGQTWSDAEITYAGPPDVWSLWRFDWIPPGPGQYVLKVRVTTQSGATSAPQHEHTDYLDGYDGSMEAIVEVV
jgi:DMSO/TMAO reductase YedYZ molybdopterin-dependent catalytic subunit